MARVGAQRGSQQGSNIAAELQADGALDLAYGNSGLATLQASLSFIPTALAINPETGESWVGGEANGNSEVLALTGSGTQQTGFGTGGVLRLAAGTGATVAALAWRSGHLLVAAGTASGCSGCELTLLNATSGQTLTSRQLTSAALGGTGCASATVTSVVFSGTDGALVGARVPTGSGCSATVVALGPTLDPTVAGPSAPSTADPGASTSADPVGPTTAGVPASADTLASSDGSTCLGEATDHDLRLSTYAGRQAAQVIAPSTAASVVAVVPLGATACSALIEQGGHSALVAQTDSSGAAPTFTRLPAAFTPQAMFRCHQHLLALGTRRSGNRRAAEIVPVPIRRGPFAAAGATAADVAATTGCTN